MAGSKVPSTPATVTQAQEVERSCAVLRELWSWFGVREAKSMPMGVNPLICTMGSYYHPSSRLREPRDIL